MNRKIEILSPAGDIETLKTGVNAGADAIYIGGSMFSARASAQNFDDEQMISAIDYAHARDVRVYVAVNTQLFGLYKIFTFCRCRCNYCSGLGIDKSDKEIHT